MTAPKNDLPIEILRETFALDPETGAVFWKKRGPKHRSDRPAGTIHPKGYRQIFVRIDGCDYRLYAHRVAFALRNGEWPDNDIDHRFGAAARDNNSQENLREATSSQNKYNVGKHADNTSGFKWVKRDNRPRKNPWRACVRKENKEHAKSGFATAEAAYAWACATAQKLHGEFYNPGIAA